MKMVKQFIEFGTPEYHESIQLRDAILRKPLNLMFLEEDLATEFDSTHIGCYDEQLRLVGCLVMKPINNAVVKMRQVAISEYCQGKGIGTSLVKFAEVWAKDSGYQKIELSARIKAVPFYLRMDYSKTGEEYIEVSIPHYRMEKELK